MRLPHIHWSYLYGDLARTIVTALAVILLLFVLINQQADNSRQLKLNTQVLTTQSQILDNQKQQLTALQDAVTELKNSNQAQLDNLKAYVGCLFKIATTPHTTTAPPPVTDPSQCDFPGQTFSGNGTSPSVKTTTPSKAPATNKGGNTPPALINPGPSKGVICKLTFGLLGC